MKTWRTTLALVLTLALTLTLAAPAAALSEEFWNGYYDGWAEGYDQGVQDHLDGKKPQAVSDAGTYDEGNQSGRAEGYKQGYQDGREYEEVPVDAPHKPAEVIKAHGGKPGKINVRLDGQKMLKFGAVWPENQQGRVMVPVRAVLEALGAQVTYEGGTLLAVLGDVQLRHTVGTNAVAVTRDGQAQSYTMDRKSYVKSGRAMVPVRFFSETLGCEVFWDEVHRTVVLLNFAREMEKADDAMKAINLILSDQTAAIQESVNYAGTGQHRLDLTMFDTLNGNRSATATATTQALFNRTGCQLQANFQMEQLLGLLAPLAQSAYGAYGDTGDTEDMQPLQQMQQLLGKLELTCILNGKTGQIAVTSPALTELLGEPYWLTETMPQALQERCSVGTLLRQSVLLDEPTPIRYWEAFHESAQSAAALLGDANFVKQGSTYTFQMTPALLLALLGASDLDGQELQQAGYTMDLRLRITDTGNGTCNYTVAAAARTDELKLELALDKQALNSRLTAKIHVKNTLEATLTSAVATSQTSRPVPTAPPTDGQLMKLEDAF